MMITSKNRFIVSGSALFSDRSNGSRGTLKASSSATRANTRCCSASTMRICATEMPPDARVPATTRAISSTTGCRRQAALHQLDDHLHGQGQRQAQEAHERRIEVDHADVAALPVLAGARCAAAG